MDKLIYLVYARKSARHNWNNQTRTDSKEHALNVAHSIMNDVQSLPDNWQIRVVTIYESVLEDTHEGKIPDNLKFNVYWYDLGMIPFVSMQSRPDQSIYNGGN